ncbi:unnamed protein product, partial [Rotaria sp. Silwood1]
SSTTTTASTITVTSNTCTSNWNSITLLYHCYNSCPSSSQYAQYTYAYTAIANVTRITFALRNDWHFFGLDNISIWNNAAPNTQLIVNGDFETNKVTPWIYCNPFNANFSGEIATGNVYDQDNYKYMPKSGSDFYFDGAVGNPDYLSQTFVTIIGNIYTISFWLLNPISTNVISVDILMSI